MPLTHSLTQPERTIVVLSCPQLRKYKVIFRRRGGAAGLDRSAAIPCEVDSGFSRTALDTLEPLDAGDSATFPNMFTFRVQALVSASTSCPVYMFALERSR